MTTDSPAGKELHNPRQARRWWKSALLLIVGFLVFAPPGTLIFSTIFVASIASLAGKFFVGDNGTQPHHAPSSVPTLARSSGASTTATVEHHAQRRLAAALPPEARGMLITDGEHARVSFVMPDVSDARARAQQHALAFFHAAFGVNQPFRSVEFIVKKSDGQIGLAMRLNRSAAALVASSEAQSNPNAFLRELKEISRTHHAADIDVHVEGCWSE